jgi:hypothetical protein
MRLAMPVVPACRLPATRRLVAGGLVAEGFAAVALGLWLVGMAAFGPPVSLGRTGDVIGPPDELVQFVAVVVRVGLGLGCCLLAGLNLVGGCRLWHAPRSAAAAAACIADALVWSLATLVGWLRAGAAAAGDGALVLPLVAAALAGGHVLAALVAAGARVAPAVAGGEGPQRA